MKFKIDADLHIHSKISLCSNDPEQTNEAILKYAKDTGLNTVCLTDHFWDENASGVPTDWYARQNFAHISQAKPLPTSNGVRFLFGCETDMDKNMNIGISKERFDSFDFVIIPTTHFHMKDFTLPKEVTDPKEVAKWWIKKLDVLLERDLPFNKIGIAHLTCNLICSGNRTGYLETLDAISQDDMRRVFAKASKAGVGIELNACDFMFAENEKSTVLRPYIIAKEMGCKFYTGSDAHHPEGLCGAPEYFKRAVDLLDLDEKDKFVICTE